MGISIKNADVEQKLRAFAEKRKLSLTRAIEVGLEAAEREEAREEESKADKKGRAAAWELFLRMAETSTYKSDGPWTRDELYDR